MRVNVEFWKRAWIVMLAFAAVSCSEDGVDSDVDIDDDVVEDVVVDTDLSANENPVVATVNFTAVWGDKEANIASMIEYVEEAKTNGVDIILFPELALTGYSDESSEMVTMAESVDGESAATFAAMADEYNMYIAYGAPESSDDATKAYNSLFVCTPSGDVESYQAISTDMSWSVEGSSLKTITTQWGDMGLSVGTEIFDMPEMVRVYSGQDCVMVLNSTSIAVDDYVTSIPATAIYDEYNVEYYAPTTEDYYRINAENNLFFAGVFVAYSNLSGDSSDGDIEFIGSSLILGPSATYPEVDSGDKYNYLAYYAGSIGESSSEIVYCEADLSRVPHEGWSALTQLDIFQPDLYSQWYANFATVSEPTATTDPTVAVVNMNPVWADKAANFAVMEAYMESAAFQGVNIIAFPELVLADYAYTEEYDYIWQSMIDNAESVTGEYAEKILAKAIELDMYVIYGTSEVNPDDDTHPYNSAFVASPDDQKTYSYQKIHPVEGAWCSWGTTPLIVETPWGGMGVSICMDSYAYPELSRYYALSGCRIFVNPTASSSYARDNFPYNTSLSTIASRDHMLVLSADLVGEGAAEEGDTDNLMTLSGKAVIIGNSGTSAIYYNEMSLTEEVLYIATPDMSETGLDASTTRADIISAGYGAL
ncbi:MAG: carbon-nitrogen hydrolase family protein [Rikenellaceae bacterium]